MDLRLGIVIGTSLLLASAQPEPPPPSACTSFADLTIPCGCTFLLETLDPVCGSDGRTYLSECHLECRKYLNRVDIKIQYSGECDHEFECKCPSKYVPVCASNGITYSNDCTLKCATAKDIKIRLKHNGDCGSVDQGNSEETSDETRRWSNLRSNRRKKKKQQLLRQRTKEPEFHRPSSEFFKQPFDVEPHRKTPKPYPNIVDLDSSEPIIPEAPLKKCVCAEVHHPVCGSDKKTYSNFCVFFCISKNMENLKFNHWGACNKPKPTPKPQLKTTTTSRSIATKEAEVPETKCVCQVLFPQPLICYQNRKRSTKQPTCHNRRTYANFCRECHNR